MKVVFRVDASIRMGCGHIMRCLVLAEALRMRRINTYFICRMHTGHMIDTLTSLSIPVTVLPAPVALVDDTENYSAWLGVTQTVDATETIAALNGEQPDWLIVDHYGLDVQWEKTLRPHVGKLLVIDDLVNRLHDCDVLLDQNYSTGDENRYAKLVPSGCRCLLGPRYALLRPEYSAYRKTLPARNGQVRRILVSMGGSDPANATGMVLKALSCPELQEVQVDVVVGANNPHRKTLEQQALQRLHTTLYDHQPHLADLMVLADISIGAGGTTTWERLCLGLPSLVVSIGENQIPACKALMESRLINYLGHISSLKCEQIRDSLLAMMSDPCNLVNLSLEGQSLVDGLGTLRLVEHINPTAIEQLWMRPAQQEDMGINFSLLNEKDGHLQSPDGKGILRKTRQGRLFDNPIDYCSRLFFLMAGILPVGQIHFAIENNEACIDYSLDFLVYDRHWDGILIRMGIHMLHESIPVNINGEIIGTKQLPRTFCLRRRFDESNPRKNICFQISILSDHDSWLNDYIPEMIINWLEDGHRVLWTHRIDKLLASDFCFYLSCSQIVSQEILSQFKHNLVIHESALPQGKGWSPLTWQILEGKNSITVTMFEAVEKVDNGAIYAQKLIEFEGYELIDELRAAQATATITLCRQFVSNYPEVLTQAQRQEGDESFYPRRKPADSRIDPHQSLAQQFNLLRVVDNIKYPAFFDWCNKRYVITIRHTKEIG